MTNIIIKVVKKNLLYIIKKNKEIIKKREKDRYRSMTGIERNEKKNENHWEDLIN